MSKIRSILLLLSCISLTFGLSYLMTNYDGWAYKVMPFKDYSVYGQQYELLKNIQLKAKSVTFDHVENGKFLGQKLQFSVFKAYSPVDVQMSPLLEQHPEFKTLIGKYTVSVASDPTDQIRLAFLRQIALYWSAKSASERQDSAVFRDIFAQKGHYVLCSDPFLGAISSSNNSFFYSAGKLIRITFDGFSTSLTGSGGLSQFERNNLLFNSSNAQIRCEEYSGISPNQFLAQYRAGFFAKIPNRELK